MSDINIKALIETIKYLPEEQKENILYLTEKFLGEEDTINDYVKNELNI